MFIQGYTEDKRWQQAFVDLSYDALSIEFVATKESGQYADQGDIGLDDVYIYTKMCSEVKHGHEVPVSSGRRLLVMRMM